MDSSLGRLSWDTDSVESSDTEGEFYSLPSGNEDDNALVQSQCTCSREQDDNSKVLNVAPEERDRVSATHQFEFGSVDKRMVDAGGSTLVLSLLFDSFDARFQAWSYLEQAMTEDATVLLTPEIVGDAPQRPCLTIVFAPKVPLSGMCNQDVLQRRAEQWLGCPRSRLGRLSPVLRKATSITLELIPCAKRERWIGLEQSVSDLTRIDYVDARS